MMASATEQIFLEAGPTFSVILERGESLLRHGVNRFPTNQLFDLGNIAVSRVFRAGTCPHAALGLRPSISQPLEVGSLKNIFGNRDRRASHWRLPCSWPLKRARSAASRIHGRRLLHQCAAGLGGQAAALLGAAPGRLVRILGGGRHRTSHTLWRRRRKSRRRPETGSRIAGSNQ
jgi:hypothetical protein